MPLSAWTQLHQQTRYRPKYPNEHVVRFLAGLPVKSGLALDIGAGAGRHTKLLSEFGFTPVATDISLEGLRHCPWVPSTTVWTRWSNRAVQASMTALPFNDATFDVALAFGSFYYGDWYDMQAAVNEMHRIMKAGGHGFVVLRTLADSRFQRGECVGNLTWRQDSGSEQGMEITFVTEENLKHLFGDFSSMRYERCDTTRNNRMELDSEFLVMVVK